jgi:hypothetical protein
LHDYRNVLNFRCFRALRAVAWTRKRVEKLFEKILRETPREPVRAAIARVLHRS